MKIRLLFLVGIGFASLSLMAQNPVYLYNKGLMSVVGLGIDPEYTSANNKTTLYINGNFVAGGGNDAGGNPVVCNVFLQGSQTVLTGDFIHDVNVTTKNSAKSSNVFTLSPSYEPKYVDYGSRFVFRGTKAQSIRLADNVAYGTDYSPFLKGINFIDFPDMVIDNQNHVTLVPELAAQAHNLFFTKGRLILDSRRAKDSDFKDGGGGNISTDPTLHSAATSSMLAHFMLYKSTTNTTDIGRILTKNSSGSLNDNSNKDLFGAVQVNLAVDDPAVANANERNGRSLIAMGSPFKEMRSDYFFWNWVMVPTGESIIGQTNPGNTMTDPEYVLKAGKAFVFGVDLRGTNVANYDYDIHPKYKNKGILFADRFGAAGDNGKYSFSRFGPMYNKTTNIYHTAIASPKNDLNPVSVSNAAYTQEILNNESITIPLVSGYNYFSNPFTAPLDLSDLIHTTSGTSLPTAWGTGLVTGDGTVSDRVLTNKVWILDPRSKGSGTWDVGHTGMQPGNKWVSVTATYRVMKAVAGTTSNIYDSGTQDKDVIAPLQMFVLYATPKAVGKSFTLPLAKRSIDKNALFVRSAPATSKYAPKDDFLFEVFDTKTTTADRVAIAIRTPQEVMTDGEYAPTKKLISFVAVGETSAIQSETVEGDVRQTEMSTLFTKDNEGNALESNILGVPSTSDTHSVTLYMTPSATAQNITMKASRLVSADRVIGITLIDKKDNKEYNLWGEKAYTIATKPTDQVDRFTLRFKFATSGIEGGGNAESKNITSYYANGTLTVAGFEDSDYGSVISVFDIQGRRVAQAKVDGASVDIREAFFTGAYIVKVVGNKSYAAKFLVK